jgi:signal transduction histidine kinase
MRFTVRSLGGKLVISAALTLLLCMLLFSAASWYLLKFFYKHEAEKDATTHLTALINIKGAYHKQVATLIQDLDKVADYPEIFVTVSKPLSQSSQRDLTGVLLSAITQYHLSSLAIISKNRSILVQLSDAQYQNGFFPLVSQALEGKTVSLLQVTPFVSNRPSPGSSSWYLDLAVPIENVKNPGDGPLGVLVAAQRIDDYFALDLARNASILPRNTGLNVILCGSNRILGTTIHNITKLDRHISDDALCAPRVVNVIDGAEHYLTKSSGLVRNQNQLGSSPSLVIVDIEPLYSINAHTERAVQILIGLGFFIIALGVAAYALIARTFFVRPLRRLQARVTALVADSADAGLSASAIDELGMLARSFNLLSESLNTREYESHVITKQMSDLLTMSDVLISTLNLENLLGEIVSRLGHIMDAKGVSLLLYGREMQSPWAVAQWSNKQLSNGHVSAIYPSQQHEAVTVHTDPAGDITMAATTKMAAIPASATRSVPPSSGKRSAIRAPKLTSQTGQAALHHPRIPRPALRDLDMILARMTMQKQKIAYGEDVQMIYQERGEAWSRMALEAGYRSVIAVPLLLQEQVIGAVVIYDDRPYRVSQRDTFLLSTAAIQAAMGIQNALLFAEVKEKNTALERVNHLKSQFLATVTHELRTPLHSIISYGALILEGFVEGELTAEQEEHIQFIVHRAEDLSRLVDDMLDLSKIEADRLEVQLEPLALEACLTETVNQLKPMANTKGLYLTMGMEDDLPIVLADSRRLRQVLINMVSNALKFTEKGGVSIRCTLLDRYDMVRISVSDTGIGISPAALDYIFEAFRQADGSTTRRFGGTGLGLTIARKLIELQAGEVSVESIVGHGSTFSFTLPVASPTKIRAWEIEHRQGSIRT